MTQAEIFNVVDDDDRVVGQATRAECHQQRLLHRSVVFLILDERGRVFVNRRSDEKDFFPGYWSIAFGGHVHAGESYHQALERELLEETGLGGEGAVQIGYYRKRIPEEQENVVVFAVEARQPLMLDATEVIQGEFMGVGELEEKLRIEPFLPETPTLLGLLKSYLTL